MAKEKEQKIVDIHARVKVVATNKHPYASEGDELHVGKLQVENLLKKGFIKK